LTSCAADFSPEGPLSEEQDTPAHAHNIAARTQDDRDRFDMRIPFVCLWLLEYIFIFMYPSMDA
jgi:hypothetical protein